MEAPLHHSPVPVPAPVVMQQQAAAVSAVMAQKPPPPPPTPAAMAMAMAGREQCPRCASRDTKFCYYNNYNTAQPRHFCRACRRYWTLGGSLRNVPVGGSTRKRPRPARPTRALAAAVATASSSAEATTTTSGVSPVPAPAAAQNVGLLSSLPLLGSVPLLEGRLGFDLGLGQPPAGSTGSSGDMAQLGFGSGPPLWPATVLEGDRAAGTTWKSGGGMFPPAALWQELAAAMPPAAGAGAPQLLL